MAIIPRVPFPQGCTLISPIALGTKTGQKKTSPPTGKGTRSDRLPTYPEKECPIDRQGMFAELPEIGDRNGRLEDRLDRSETRPDASLLFHGEFGSQRNGFQWKRHGLEGTLVLLQSRIQGSLSFSFEGDAPGFEEEERSGGRGGGEERGLRNQRKQKKGLFMKLPGSSQERRGKERREEKKGEREKNQRKQKKGLFMKLPASSHEKRLAREQFPAKSVPPSLPKAPLLHPQQDSFPFKDHHQREHLHLHLLHPPPPPPLLFSLLLFLLSPLSPLPFASFLLALQRSLYFKLVIM